MCPISLVLFDMHDVLCRYDRAKRLADLERLSGRPVAAIYDAIWASGFETEADSGRYDAAAYLHGFGTRLGYPITLKEWLVNRKQATTPIPQTLAIMARLKTATAVLTNNHTLVRDHLAALFPELAALCQQNFYVSAQFGAAKPTPEVYRLCAAAVGVAPEAILFIDDSSSNVAGAAAAGCCGHVFTSPEDLETALRGHGVL